jgi:hypothetical protein
MPSPFLGQKIISGWEASDNGTMIPLPLLTSNALGVIVTPQSFG